MNITVVTTAEGDELSLELLEKLGMPFRKPEEKEDSRRG
jgi:ribosomal protein L5